MHSIHILHAESDPPELLKSAIKCFWHTHIPFGDPFHVFEIMPDGYAEIIFHSSRDCYIISDDENPKLPSPYAMGLYRQPVRLMAHSPMDVIGVRCFPWTVFSLLEMSPGIGGIDLTGHPVSRLQEGLFDLRNEFNLESALERLTHYFISAHGKLAVDPTLQRAGSAMLTANGSLPVFDVAAEAHSTVRTLQRRFRQFSGYTVKDVSGWIRFEQVRNKLWLNPDTNMAALAQDLGFTDQSHLIREFKRYSGVTPAAFVRINRGKSR